MEEEEIERRAAIRRIVIRILIFLTVFVCLVTIIFLILKRNRTEKKEENRAVTEEKSELLLPEDEDKSDFKFDDEESETEKREDKISAGLWEGIGEFEPEDGARICEYSSIDLPGVLKESDLLDVRLSFADGRDFTVLSGKKALKFKREEQTELIWLSLNEDEIILMESATSDMRLFEGAKLYAAIYNGKEAKNYEINYPVNKKAGKILKEYYEKNTEIALNRYEIITDKILDKEREQMKEKEPADALKWKEAASYWDEE